VEIGLEIHDEKNKYMGMSQDQYVEQNSNLNIGNKFFETVD
jgi:hypothetical protein